MTEIAWGLIGPGRIAHRFAEAAQGSPNTRLVAVTGGREGSASAFAAQWSREGKTVRVHANLHDLLADPDVQALYIATPHTAHGDAVRAALLAGKPVLCEKPLAPTGAEAQALMELAREQGVFLMEAVWTRFLPAWQQTVAWVAAGRIGAVQSIQSSFCFVTPFDAQARHFNPALAGGSLLDIGIYNLSMTQWVLAAQGAPALESFDMHGTLAPTGVDQRVNATLHFAGGITSQFVCAFDTQADNTMCIYGSQCHIVVHAGFWQTTGTTLCRHGEADQTVDAPFRINGFEYEIEEACRCIRAGKLQSDVIPHADTMATLKLIDAMRGRLGVRYPFEPV